MWSHGERPFRVGQKIGEGGMGVVYRGETLDGQQEVAIKWVHETGSVGFSREHFQAEVRAQARMDSPYIVGLYDYGQSRQAASMEPPRQGTGKAYVVMELAEAGSSADRPFIEGLEDWSTIRRYVMQVLRGLCHAHARGVVHRDLKPENLLVFDRGARRLKIADFGLAYALEEVGRRGHEKRRARVVGTPQYMAPEQWRGDWRQFGPWTDLYALGCIVFEWCCRRFMVEGQALLALRDQHLGAGRASFSPVVAVPVGLEAWLAKMTAPEVADRFQHPAHALWSLEEMGEAMMTPVGQASPGTPGRKPTRTRALDPTKTMGPAPTLQGMGVQGRERATLGVKKSWPSVPRKALEAPHDEGDGHGVGPMGLGLFDLREPPFVGRPRERRMLWRYLVGQSSEGDQRIWLTLVEGASGVGKSRLVRWVTTRARERAVGVVVRLDIGRRAWGEGAGEGWGAMIADHHRLWGLGEEAMRRRLVTELGDVLEEDEEAMERRLEGLLQLVLGRDRPRERWFDMAHPSQRFGVVAWWLAAISRGGRTLLWIEDLQWGRQAMGFLEYLSQWERPPDALRVVATWNREAAGEPWDGVGRIEGLCRCSGAREICLKRLDGPAYDALLDRLLPLAPAVKARLGQGVKGAPLLTKQVIGEWIGQGQLEMEQGRYRFQGGLEPPIPRERHRWWLRRIERALQTMEDKDREEVIRTLEVAAIMGRQVVEEEWREACAGAGLVVDRGGWVRVAAIGLAERGERGWRFAEEAVAASLRQRAREGDRWVSHHRALARWWSAKTDGGSAGGARRLAHFWMEGKRAEEALSPLLMARDHFYRLGDTASATRCLVSYRAILEVLDEPRGSMRWLRAEEKELQDRWVEGETRAVLERAMEAIERCQGTAARGLEARFRRLESLAWFRLGHQAKAREAAYRALECAQQQGSDVLVARMKGRLGRQLQEEGRWEESRRLLEEAVAGFDAGGRRRRKAWVMMELCWVELHLEEVASARQRLDELDKFARVTGQVQLQSNVLNTLGGLEKKEGRYRRARHFFERFERLESALGDPEGRAIAAINIADAAIRSGDFQVASRALERGQAIVAQVDLPVLDMYLHWTRALKMASQGRWRDLEQLVMGVAERWPEESSPPLELKGIIEEVVEICEAAPAGHVETVIKSVIANTEGG